MTVRAIDCWVNVNMSGLGRPDYLKDVAKNYFKQGEDFFRDYTIEEILKTMDAPRGREGDPHHRSAPSAAARDVVRRKAAGSLLPRRARSIRAAA